MGTRSELQQELRRLGLLGYSHRRRRFELLKELYKLLKDFPARSAFYSLIYNIIRIHYRSQEAQFYTYYEILNPILLHQNINPILCDSISDLNGGDYTLQSAIIKFYSHLLLFPEYFFNFIFQEYIIYQLSEYLKDDADCRENNACIDVMFIIQKICKYANTHDLSSYSQEIMNSITEMAKIIHDTSNGSYIEREDIETFLQRISQ